MLSGCGTYRWVSKKMVCVSCREIDDPPPETNNFFAALAGKKKLLAPILLKTAYFHRITPDHLNKEVV